MSTLTRARTQMHRVQSTGVQGGGVGGRLA